MVNVDGFGAWWRHNIGTIAFVTLLAVAVGGFIRVEGVARNTQDAAELGVQAQSALCTFKSDLQRRVDESIEFLQTHPEPEPIPGVPREQFQVSINNQTETISTLDRVLSCGTE